MPSHNLSEKEDESDFLKRMAQHLHDLLANAANVN